MNEDFEVVNEDFEVVNEFCAVEPVNEKVFEFFLNTLYQPAHPVRIPPFSERRRRSVLINIERNNFHFQIIYFVFCDIWTRAPDLK